jgi:hypothetical protein
MALYKTDSKPAAISLSDAYTAIRDWYQNHPDPARYSERHCPPDYARSSARLIKALPPAEGLADVEKIAVLCEVVRGHLEWAYDQSDGRYKMAAYAHAALEALGHSYNLAPAEIELLHQSVLWPILSSQNQ